MLPQAAIIALQGEDEEEAMIDDERIFCIFGMPFGTVHFIFLSPQGRCTMDLAQLREHPLREKLVHHSLFRWIDEIKERITKDQVLVILQQWWHPLNYFPDFLGRLVAKTRILRIKTAISDILFEELGEGDPTQAHEQLFMDTMVAVGFPADRLARAELSPATHELISAYAESFEFATEGFGVGVLCATEIVDEAMVTVIGKAVTFATGHTNLPWVNIHLKQEGGHVDNAARSAQSLAFRGTCGRGFEWILEHWIRFFDWIEREIRK